MSGRVHDRPLVAALPGVVVLPIAMLGGALASLVDDRREPSATGTRTSERLSRSHADGLTG